MALVRGNMISPAGADEWLSIFPKYMEMIPFDVRKGIFNATFFMLTLYFIIHLVLSMWPLLIAFLVLYFHNTGRPFNSHELVDILVKVGIFACDLIFNILVGIMKFVNE